VLALSALLAGCGGRMTAAPLSPERPGTWIKLVNPNPSKWAGTAGRIRGQALPISIFACKPLACAGAASVAVQIGDSPTRHPDKTALEKAAKLLPTQAKAQDLMMEAASDGDERIASLSSAVTQIRGYPAIVAENKRTSRGKAQFIFRGDLFIGQALVKIVSASSTRSEARRNFDEFTGVMDIVDFEPALPRAPGSAAGEEVENAMAPTVSESQTGQ
jgi:hypothetical protein